METGKFIKGQSEIVYCSCPIETEMTLKWVIDISSEGITFTDDTCSSLPATDDANALMACSSDSIFLRDTIGSASVYTLLGSSGVYMPTSRPTMSPTMSPAPTIQPTTPAPSMSPAPSYVPTPMPSPVPTTSMPSVTPVPSAIPTITAVPTVDPFARFNAGCNKVLKGATTNTLKNLVHYFELTFDSHDGNLDISTCHAASKFDTTLALYAAGDCGGTMLAWNDDYKGCKMASRLIIPTEADASFCVGLGGFSNNYGDYEISFNCSAVIPSALPTPQPTLAPSASPTPHPSISQKPSSTPAPTKQPTLHPSPLPSHLPTQQPTITPSLTPTATPTGTPVPTALPTLRPTPAPSSVPTFLPTLFPTVTRGGRRRLKSLRKGRSLSSTSDEIIYTTTIEPEGCEFGYELTLEECRTASIHYGVPAFYDMVSFVPSSSAEV